ncbi:MAG: hypothetical protein ABRQ37_13370 [Candidatus Eremiobacterota bacterium]
MSNKFPSLEAILKACENSEKKVTYFVPAPWTLDPMKGTEQLAEMVSSGDVIRPVSVESPYKLIEETVKNILKYNKEHDEPEKDTEIKTGKGIKAVNSLARVLSMYDHNGDGFIGSSGTEHIILNSEGICEMGTFIKNILVLPYLKALGFNTIHLQPITEIGVYGKKGNLGSPFAIRDPFSIDPDLADPLFEFNAEEQYLAFIEAAHALGMMVIQEVIPRTLSIDSKILEKNPEYGYWIKEGSPKRMPDYYHRDYEYPTSQGKRRFPDRKSFEEWFFGEYQGKIYSGKYGIDDLIDVNKTDPEYVSFFVSTPDEVKREKDGRLVGYYKNSTDRAEVFPAFCDTPFEIQPFWQDVTYLRLYVDNHGDLPLVTPLSFVTAKFFKDVEPEIERKYRNEPVWNMITGYFDKFKHMGVDGFVLDMGHALPADLKSAIKNVLPNLWEENLAAGFSFLSETPAVITGKVFAYGEPGYNNREEMKYYEENPVETVMFHIKNMRRLFEEVSEFEHYKGKMFGYPDNYNTKRIGQSTATRILSEAPLRNGIIPDFTKAPVDQDKARKISLLYYSLFSIFSEKEESPFLFNPVFGTEFVATSTVNVGLNTHIDEANQFFDYMSPDEQAKHRDAEKLLLMSKPDTSTGEWIGKNHFIGEILELNSSIEQLKPLLHKNRHMEVLNTRNREVLFLSLYSEEGEKLAIVANLDLEREHTVELPFCINHYYFNRPDNSPGEGYKGQIVLPPAHVTVFSY